MTVVVDELARWVHFDGPMPESVRPLVEAMRAAEPPGPTAEEIARAAARFFATADARLAAGEGMDEGEEDEDEGEEEDEEERAPGSRRSGVVMAGASAAAEEEALRGFEAWAVLSLALLGAGAEVTAAALRARGMTAKAWEEIDEGYLAVLSGDLRAGREQRPAIYQAKLKEEMARRGGATEAGPALALAGHPKPAVVQAPAWASGTGDAVELAVATVAAMGRLPFKEGAEGAAERNAAERKPGPPVAKTQPVTVASGKPGKTLPGDGDTTQTAVPALPFVGARGHAAVVWFPTLTVPQYVSLRMELQVRVRQEGETEQERREGEEKTLLRYGVPSAGSRRALMAYWGEMERRPEVRGEIQAAVGIWVGWATGWWR